MLPDRLFLKTSLCERWFHSTLQITGRIMWVFYWNKPPPLEPASPSHIVSSVPRSPSPLLPSSSPPPSSSVQWAESAPRSWPFAEGGEAEWGGDTRDTYETLCCSVLFTEWVFKLTSISFRFFFSCSSSYSLWMRSLCSASLFSSFSSSSLMRSLSSAFLHIFSSICEQIRINNATQHELHV